MATGAVASSNVTPPSPKINPRAPLGGLLATEFIANLQKLVDNIARAACARSSKDFVFTKTVQDQIKEVGNMLKQVLDCMRTFLEAPPAPSYQAPAPYRYPPMWGNAPGAAYYAYHRPRSTPTTPESDLP
jgi:hypothetical protein